MDKNSNATPWNILPQWAIQLEWNSYKTLLLTWTQLWILDQPLDYPDTNLQNMYLFQSLMPVKWLSTLAVLHKFAFVKNYVNFKWGDCFNCSCTSNVKYVSLSKYDFYSCQLWLLYIVLICCNSTKIKSVICAKKMKSDICANKMIISWIFSSFHSFPKKNQESSKMDKIPRNL